MPPLLAAIILGCSRTPQPAELPLGERAEPAQLAALEEALLADPAQALSLCDEVTAPNARDRCARLRKRPHLWQPRVEAAVAIPSPYTGTPALASPCGQHPQPRACWSRFAYGKAATGDMTAAAGACAAVEAGPWREECWFQAGEAAAERRLAAGYADSLAMCALAGRFQRDCLSHSVSLLAEDAPETPNGDWSSTVTAADTITDSWAGIDPAQGARWRDQLWAEALLYAYDRSLTLSGAPLDSLPEDAAPHVHAALAWRLMALSGAESHSLDGWTQVLQEAAEARTVTTLEDRPRRALASIPALDPPEGPQTRSWLGVSRRLHSPDAATDRKLCVLEAAARLPGSLPLLEAGTADGDASVQETAARLLRVLEPQLPIH